MTDKAPSPEQNLMVKIPVGRAETLVAWEVDVHGLVDNLKKISRFGAVYPDFKDFKMESATGISVLSLDGNTASVVDIHDILFSGSNFLGSKFLGSKVLGSKFLGSKFLGSKFLGSNFLGSKFLRSKFSESRFLGFKFLGSKFLLPKFLGSNFLGSKFLGSN